MVKIDLCHVVISTVKAILFFLRSVVCTMPCNILNVIDSLDMSTQIPRRSFREKRQQLLNYHQCHQLQQQHIYQQQQHHQQNYYDRHYHQNLKHHSQKHRYRHNRRYRRQQNIYRQRQHKNLRRPRSW